MHKAYAATPIGQVHYRTGGEGLPILLLHQTPQSSLQFKNVFPLLMDAGLQVIAPDAPGYGMSDTPESPPSIEEYASVLPYVLDEIGVEKAIVVGHHTGASQACAFATAHPGRVIRVVLHGVPWYTEDEKEERLSRLHVDTALKADGSHLTDRWNWIFSRVGKVASLEACQMNAVHTFWAGETEWYCHQAAFKYDMTSALKAISQPTLVLSNSGDLIHYIWERLKGLRPDFTFTELDGGCVYIIYDEPERWVNSVIEFIKAEA
ncbi:MAG: alpha/beta hydrolase [Rhodospirillaceae bacterium]|nr:alpha/beta hydrolase [Rhodospirillaceae bacterium]